MLSIIIPTYNEEKYLPTLLDSIKEQSYHDYEIIVADNNSKDDTRKIAKKYGCRVVEGGNPAQGRNNGGKVAKGKYLLFLDADVVMPRGFLKEIMTQTQQNSIDVGTVYHDPLSDKFVDRCIAFIDNACKYLFQKIKPHAGGWCIFCTKTIFTKVGGFDETMQVSEDHDFVQKCAKHGTFKLVGSVRLLQSYRRWEEEGRVKLGITYTIIWLNDLFGKTPKKKYNYTYGRHK